MKHPKTSKWRVPSSGWSDVMPYKCLVSVSSEPPVASVTPAGPLRVRVGEPINLECQASGEPRPSVSWHRLDSNRKTMLSSPVPMESNAVMQVLRHLIAKVTRHPKKLGKSWITIRSRESWILSCLFRNVRIIFSNTFYETCLLYVVMDRIRVRVNPNSAYNIQNIQHAYRWML